MKPTQQPPVQSKPTCKPSSQSRRSLLRIKTAINGQPCVNLNDPQGDRRGAIAFQLHSGGPTEVRFRDIRLEVDPKPELSEAK